MRLNYKIFTLTGLFLFAIGASGNALDSLRLEQKGGNAYVIHQIDKGETLYGISKRYAADIQGIIAANDIVNNQISIGQELMIPIESVASGAPETVEVISKETIEAPKVTDGVPKRHTVTAGETLYSISRRYDAQVEDIKRVNEMSGNSLSLGQVLLIPIGNDASTNAGSSEEVNIAEEEVTEEVIEDQEPAIPEGFTVYYVQTGESLETIASRFSVRPDSIVYWNGLPNSYLTIGQKLLVKGELDQAKLLEKDDIEQLPYGTRRKVIDNSGFTKIFEEGSARKIEAKSKTEKYLALHRTLSVGSLVEVRNLMNNQKIFVRVVGKLPETGLNKKVMIRLSPICFERLGVIDPKTRVEVSYFLD